MKNVNGIIAELLSCGYLDVAFLDRLTCAYSIGLDIYEISAKYGAVNDINILIYEAFLIIKDMFISDNQEQIKKLSLDTESFEEGEDYEIFTNYLDTHLQFTDDRLDEIYQNWRKL